MQPEEAEYFESNGFRAKWRKIKYENKVGWVNEGLLRQQ
jgi:hypothetical protein